MRIGSVLSLILNCSNSIFQKKRKLTILGMFDWYKEDKFITIRRKLCLEIDKYSIPLTSNFIR